MWIRIQPNKICKKLLDAEKQTKTKNTGIAQNLKTMELVHIYLILHNKITISTNFLAFFSFFSQNFPSWIRIRIQEGK